MSLTLFLALQAAATSPGIPVAITDVHVVDVRTGAVVRNQAVLIDGGRFARVVDMRVFAAPPGAVVIAGGGRYLTPGLIDTHVHVHDRDDLALLLAHGVTTARILDGERSDLAGRRRLSAADMAPDLRVCRQVNGVDDSADATRIVAQARRDGFDCLKLYSPPPWSREHYRQLVRAAASQRLPLEGHLPRNLPFDWMASGDMQGSIAHLEELLYTYFFREENRPAGRVDSTRTSIVASAVARRGIAVGTTLNNYRTIGEVTTDGLDSLAALPELAYMPRSVRQRWLDERNVFRRRISAADGERLLTGLYPLLEKLARDIVAAGGVLVLGTDASRNLPFMIPGPSVHWEMAALVRAGLSPADVLRAATVNAAALLGDPSRGEVAAGFRADAVLLDANPLEDIATFGRIAGVLRAGVWFPAAELDERLERLARSRR